MSEQSRGYNLYIRSDHWAALRQRKLDESGKVCASCGSKYCIHIHHIRYRNYIDVQLGDLIPLCCTCHDDLHLAAKYEKRSLEGVELPEITNLITAFRLTPKYSKRVEKLKKRRALRLAREIETPTTKKIRRTRNQILRKCLRRCRSENFSKESLENVIQQVSQIIESL